MAHFVRHAKCPECTKLGKDRDGNNLGVYSDGSVYCFACGYTRNASPIQKFREEIQRAPATTVKPIILPGDITTEIPEKPWEWLKQYSLTESDINKHNILWSPNEQRICFPIFDDQQNLLAWQGRYLGTENKPKWFSQGDLKKIFHIIGVGQRKTLVLVEDLISAIRIGNCGVHSCCLFGSHISSDKWKLLRRLSFQTIIIWLDKDKQLESVKFAQQGREFGLNVRSVITENDPKTYSDTEIKNILTQ